VGDEALPRLGLVNVRTLHELTDDIECVSVAMTGDFISLTVLGVEFNTSVSNHFFSPFALHLTHLVISLIVVQLK
jgi:hypothetical protein